MTNETVLKEKKKAKKDIDFIGSELASLSERLLKVEDNVITIQSKLAKIEGRLGL